MDLAGTSAGPRAEVGLAGTAAPWEDLGTAPRAEVDLVDASVPWGRPVLGAVVPLVDFAAASHWEDPGTAADSWEDLDTAAP